jgi:HK97 family phage prohead protease
MFFVVDGNPALNRVEANSWDEADAKLNGVGAVVGELVAEGEWKSSRVACDLTELKFASDGDTMTFDGYGAAFNNVDQGGDKILPGAFGETLAQFKMAGRLPAMLYQHGKMGGGPVMPVGKWQLMEEDSRGLRVKGKLSNTSAARDLYELMKDGAIGGMSIGYRVKEFGRPAPGDDARRLLKSVSLVEVSLVNDPMNPAAVLTSVKAADEIKTERDFEAFLRDVGGFSNTRAKAIASHGYKALEASRDDGEGLKAMADALRRNAAIFKS